MLHNLKRIHPILIYFIKIIIKFLFSRITISIQSSFYSIKILVFNLGRITLFHLNFIECNLPPLVLETQEASPSVTEIAIGPPFPSIWFGPTRMGWDLPDSGGIGYGLRLNFWARPQARARHETTISPDPTQPDLVVLI